MTGEWRDRALCFGADPEIFFPDVGESYAPARKICGLCPVVNECLTNALATELTVSRFGMRGGCTPQERSRLARGKPITARTPLLTPEAERIRDDCWERGWSDRQIGDYVGADASTIRNWRRRRSLGPNFTADGSRERIGVAG